jgi:hypothetical protein
MMPKRIILDDPTRLDQIESQKKVFSRLNGKTVKDLTQEDLLELIRILLDQNRLPNRSGQIVLK